MQRGDGLKTIKTSYQERAKFHPQHVNSFASIRYFKYKLNEALQARTMRLLASVKVSYCWGGAVFCQL